MCASSADEAAIIRIVQDMALAQTADDISKTWASDMVWFDVITCAVKGGEHARAEYRKQFAQITNLRTRILDITARADGDVGFAFSVQHFLADGQGGAPNVDIVFRQTDCLMKRGGAWQIVHQHVSLPIDFSTGLAVTQSKYGEHP